MSITQRIKYKNYQHFLLIYLSRVIRLHFGDISQSYAVIIIQPPRSPGHVSVTSQSTHTSYKFTPRKIIATYDSTTTIRP